MGQQIVAHRPNWSAIIFLFYFYFWNNCGLTKSYKNSTKINYVFFTQITPMVTSSITIVKYHNQDIDLVKYY